MRRNIHVIITFYEASEVIQGVQELVIIIKQWLQINLERVSYLKKKKQKKGNMEKQEQIMLYFLPSSSLLANWKRICQLSRKVTAHFIILPWNTFYFFQQRKLNPVGILHSERWNMKALMKVLKISNSDFMSSKWYFYPPKFLEIILPTSK